VTRFQSRSEEVVYEIAQIRIIVKNTSPESDGVDTDGIVVYAEEKVSHLISPRGKY
jgi:hypothetical protein